uniref:Uncharacterized protein n=1 Tax=Leersia perrieri TaxID=77586 RepID=A0A0D9UVX0_9ORYZ
MISIIVGAKEGELVQQELAVRQTT